MASYIHVPDEAPAVPKIDVTVDESDYRSGALKLIKELRPSWKPSEVKLKFFTDGITNKLLGCYIGAFMQDVVLVRIYGNKTELLVDRENEVKSFRVLHANRCAPHLYCTFNNGLCYEFLQGTALEPEHIRSPPVFSLIAKQLAKYHVIHAHNGWVPQSDLWVKMGKYFALIPKYLKDPEKNARLSMEVPSPRCLREELVWLQQSLSVLGSPVVLCHNDLLCKNIIYNAEEGENDSRGCGCPAPPCPGEAMERDKPHAQAALRALATYTPPGHVKFIDYEYAGYNYQAYDIGNHFNEFAGLNEVDYSHYPQRAFQLEWLRSYLEAFKENKGQGSVVTDREVDTLYVQVNKFALASHFFWGLWALIQAKVSTIDFDFLGYAVLRFNQYFKMKLEVASLNLPE
ncbi:Ethanolamine kinase 1 [Dissostichus eleginoides]|nr:Ethanolamine kinase 1 [Dissostichus eleginoides]